MARIKKLFEEFERRDREREALHTVGRARRVGARDVFDVATADVSRTGLQLECLPEDAISLEPGTRLQVVLPGWRPDEPVAVTGTVMWDGLAPERSAEVVDATGTDEHVWRVGLRMDEAPPDLAAELLPREAAA